MSTYPNIVLKSSKVRGAFDGHQVKKALIPTIFNDLFLDHGKWNDCNIHQLCPYILKWEIKGCLEIRGNKQPQILKQISHIKFEHLRVISVSDNKIDSVEGLNRFDMKQILKLQLHQNKLVSMRQLRKINFPQLRQIKIYKNQIVDTAPLKYLSAPYLQNFKLDLFKSHKEIGTSIGWAFQLQTEILRLLNIEGETRIIEKRKIKNLRSLYKRIKIYHK